MDALRKILVVDDVPDVADATVRLLTLLGYDCAAAYWPNQAIAIAQSFVPDVFLIDFAMPDGNGADLAERLRALPEFHDALMIAHTAFGSPAYIDRAKAAGFDAYLVKPAGAADFVRAISLARAWHAAGQMQLVAH
jgi:CheY-like chemotaxis protein